MDEKGLTVADALALQRGNNDNDGAFGNNGAWWIIILILFFCMAGNGWNNGGYGCGGYYHGSESNTIVVPASNCGCSQPVTQQGLTAAFNYNSLDNGIRATQEAVVNGSYQNNMATTNLGTLVQQGFSASQLQNCQNANAINTTINSGVNAIQSSLCGGFNDVQAALANTNFNISNCCCENREAIMQANFNNQTGFNNIVNGITTSTFELNRGQTDIKYTMAQNQAATIAAIDNVGDRIVNYLNQSKMDELRGELQDARFQISQAAQTNAIINQLQPVARPAWLVNSPYQSLNYNGVNACGCGNF